MLTNKKNKPKVIPSNEVAIPNQDSTYLKLMALMNAQNQNAQEENKTIKLEHEKAKISLGIYYPYIMLAAGLCFVYDGIGRTNDSTRSLAEGGLGVFLLIASIAIFSKMLFGNAPNNQISQKMKYFVSHDNDDSNASKITVMNDDDRVITPDYKNK